MRIHRRGTSGEPIIRLVTDSHPSTLFTVADPEFPRRGGARQHKMGGGGEAQTYYLAKFCHKLRKRIYYNPCSVHKKP